MLGVGIAGLKLCRKLDRNVQKFKETWKNLSEKTQKLLMVIVGVTLAIIIIAVLVLTLGKNGDYSVLFTGLSQEEAQEIANVLQDQDIDYKYNAADGTIRVPDAVVETTRGQLLASGYPKSGFAYDIYLDNTGLLTTESDKKQLTLYELQNRLGATIRAFDGVKDANVTIVEASERRYVLDDDSQQEASASVIITMKNGVALTGDKAQAVKNLIAHAVRGMDFTKVTVFDASTMLEVGADSGGDSSTATDLMSLTSMVESNIAANVRNVLEKLYGVGNVAVSVKGTINMEKLIQESTQYSTPEKIDEQDKTGLLEQEDLTNEDSLAYTQEAGGVVGADANADPPRYTTEDEGEDETDSYTNSTASRRWLFNVLKEQRQVDPGILEDTSIGVIILTKDTSVDETELYRLVANSAGIDVTEANDKITIIRSEGTPTEQAPQQAPEGLWTSITNQIPWPILVAIIAGILLVLLLLIFLLLRGRKKRSEAEAQEDDIDAGDQLSAIDLGIDSNDLGGDTLVAAQPDEDDDLAHSEEILNMRMQRSMRLKQNIAEFVEQNPQIAAKLVQSWLRGEEDLNGSKRNQGANNRRSK
jgi:flagellar basal-body M-ring protein/flagellar hook-basal body protein fliF